jgi:hypothetical protein
MPTMPSITESDILADVLAAGDGDLPPEAAQSILRWKFSGKSIKRMNQLADRNRRGVISAAEREVLERYLRVGSLVNLLQAKARLSLQKQKHPDRR